MHCKILDEFCLGYPSRRERIKTCAIEETQSLGVTARRRRGAGAGGEQMTINVVRIPNLPTLPNLGVGFARSRLSLSALRSPCS
jgi:hypothetical protein